MLLLSAPVFAQTSSAPKGKAAAKAGGKSASASDAPTSKGFSRMTVTPEVKQQFEGDNNRLAIIVAPNYAGSGLNPLRYTVADTLELKAELDRQGYLTTLIGPGEATAERIRLALANAKQLLDGKDQSTFLFAFSGHGFQTKDASGKDRNYLVTLGVTPERLTQDALPLDEVEKLMNDAGARRKILLIDACRNDPNAKSGEAPRTFTALQESEGTDILLSTRPGGFSYEDKELGHGIFTYYVLEALRGKAAGKDGYVTFYDLEKYVESNVVARANKQELVQRPFAQGEHYGDFLLATAAPPKPDEIAKLPQAAQQVDSNTAILWQVSKDGAKVGQSFYGLTEGSTLKLVNNKTLMPYAELTEVANSDLDPAYRHFKGPADKQLVDLAVQIKGDTVVAVKGRVGTPCPNPKVPCTTPEQMNLMLLPGEKMAAEPARTAAKRAGKGVKAAQSALSVLTSGRSSTQTTKAGAATDLAEAGLNSQNPLLEYHWETLDLTTSVPKPTAH
jgi:hypothetical protein